MALCTGTWEVSFCRVGGQYIPFDPTQCSLDESAHDWSKALPVRGVLHDRTLQVLLESVPARRFLHETGTESSSLPQRLREPLVKVDEQQRSPGAARGWRSGGRSAIVVSNASEQEEHGDVALYRLKGCGNYVDADGMRFPFPGFPVREISVAGEALGYEIRGCSWESSSLRELAMTALVAEAAKRTTWRSMPSIVPLRIGNESVGYWEYADTGGKEVTVDEKKCCTIFRTLGEKRLETHLMGGLNALIDRGVIVDESVAELEEILRSRKRIDGNNGNDESALETWIACCSGTEPYVPVSVTARFSLCIALDTDMKGDNEWIPSPYAATWQKAWQTLRSKPIPDDVSLPALLCWRLGRECGEFSRLLKANDIIWGYFFDHNPFEPHCNSHTNNFVVLPTENVKKVEHSDKLSRFVAPLDFDMAYTRASFLSPYSKEPDDALFRSWQETEVKEMERAIGGELVNSGITLDRPSPLNQSCIMNALRDTMLAGFRSGLAGMTSYADGKPEWDDQLRALITLALIMTSNLQS